MNRGRPTRRVRRVVALNAYDYRDGIARSVALARMELLPAADFTELQGAGHFIALEKPEIVADLLATVA